MSDADDHWTLEFMQERVKCYRWPPAKAKQYLKKTVTLIEALTNAKTDRGRLAAWKAVKKHLTGPHNNDMQALLMASVIQHMPEKYWSADVARVMALQKAEIAQWRRANPDWRKQRAELEAYTREARARKKS